MAQSSRMSARSPKRNPPGRSGGTKAAQVQHKPARDDVPTASPPEDASGSSRHGAHKPVTGTRHKPGPSRKVPAEARRQAILAAALSVFAERGFEAARLDDVAARAGVAKGTLYLYFRDKEALFEALVQNAVSPLLAEMSRLAGAPEVSPAQALEAFFALFQREVLGTERKLLLRLIITEGPRFPAIAELYYREVVSRGLTLMRGLAARAAADGTFATDAPARFPQLVIAPLLVALVWDSLFANIDPLDVGGLIEAHRQVLAGGKRRAS
ncbi:MAG TPA: TetR/AcrR family transcriptional regulator [Hyphomicrobiaceae bacterium]|nr:TetR/AcrR family transcriptional regulator [Hyphomicrobiaceae bacterium]